MPDYREISRRLALIHEAADEEQTLDRVLAFAMSALDCDLAGVMLTTAGRVESAGATHPLVVEADQLQMSLDEGPCLSAIREHDSFRIDFTDADQRWPRWGPAAAQLGIRSVLSTRMANLDKPTIGSVNLYAYRHAAFDQDDVELASILARHATVAYLKARRSSAADRAIDSRTSIGQAEGILMERFGVDADQAFSVLRRYSQAENIPLREVASRLVDDRRLPTLDPPADDT